MELFTIRRSVPFATPTRRRSGRPSAQDERVDVRAVLTQVDPKSIPPIYPLDVHSQRAGTMETCVGTRESVSPREVRCRSRRATRTRVRRRCRAKFGDLDSDVAIIVFKLHLRLCIL